VYLLQGLSTYLGTCFLFDIWDAGSTGTGNSGKRDTNSEGGSLASVCKMSDSGGVTRRKQTLKGKLVVGPMADLNDLPSSRYPRTYAIVDARREDMSCEDNLPKGGMMNHTAMTTPRTASPIRIVFLRFIFMANRILCVKNSILRYPAAVCYVSRTCSIILIFRETLTHSSPIKEG
jgi:hypothetical protein